ncbi:chromosome segregation protein [Niveomyces insectorum RCEF 264]|uniref:Chromosome segregation protein n=1 Tax=Niveomyces insectorum RCEF 264 TaxID=1081102 RepID=A0A167Q7L5_9HYPO|nr:chromosome segregation protein [Niveomyces insectorum RCEF 264]
MASSQDTTMPATRRARKSISSFSLTKTTDKENATIDVSAPQGFSSTAAAAAAASTSKKKSRSKSMGPGGLDALKSTSGNRRVSLAAPSRPPPRSILKPTMPLLPEIPPRKPRGKGAGAKSSPRRSGDKENDAENSTGGSTKVALRTEEEQHAAAREREERERERERAAREKEVNDHREARRKSLANRRVSFAAEATLHTFHEIDYMQDSTTSTESTTARRASSVAAPSPAPFRAQDLVGSGETLTEKQDGSARLSLPSKDLDTTGDDDNTITSLADQRDASRKARRRSSTGVSAMGFRYSTDALGDQNEDNNTITSTVYDSDGDEVEEDDEDDGDGDGDDNLGDSSDSDSDEGDGATMVTVDADETTSASVMSAMSMRSASPIESTSDLDRALELATQHAGAEAERTRRQRPVDEDEEAIPAIIGWGKKAGKPVPAGPAQTYALQQSPVAASPQSQKEDDDDATMDMDVDMDMDVTAGTGMEMTRAMGGIIRPAQTGQEEEMTMDVTRAYGGIILRQPTVDTESVPSSPMILSGDNTTIGGGPMELTTAMGVIRAAREPDTESVDNEGLEDMSMEMTTVLGGVLGVPSLAANKARRLSRRQTMDKSGGAQAEDDEAPMDMTVAVGKIIDADSAAKTVESEAPPDEETVLPGKAGTKTPAAQRGTAKPASPRKTRTTPRKSGATASPRPPPQPLSRTPTQTTPRRSGSPPKTANKASPGGLSAFRGKGLQRTPLPREGVLDPDGQTDGTPAPPDEQSPSVSAAAPAAPAAPAPSTPSGGSPARFIGSRSKSPKRNVPSAEKSTTPRSPPKPAALFAKSLFAPNLKAGAATPSVVLTPQGRPWQSAFAGAGPASPKITEIFNRRSSLVDTATDFVVGSGQKDGSAGRHGPAVTFEEPPRETSPDEGQTVSGAYDDREATQNLKDLIQNLSPKKKTQPLKGRKSLHVGSAKGLLGKRPFELDADDDDEDEFGGEDLVKRLKGPEPSPVKNIRLQQPPSVMETIGRSSRSRRSPSAATPVAFDLLGKSSGHVFLGSPQRKAAEQDGMVGEKNDTVNTSAQGDVHNNDNSGGGGDDKDDGENERIHLQDFLSMANIHFMELETTKRRATELPGSFKDKHGRVSTDEDGQPKDPKVESLVTSVCKVPLLEMYQHACRELKNYIEEGRSIMREIETETYEDNPPIFHEYTTATPAMRAQMDSQFKNIKIFARLQSKKQWYEWRTKLHEGLQEGMRKTLADLEQDQEVLRQRRTTVDAVYPALLAECETLERERVRLEAFARQLGGPDGPSLVAARLQKRKLQNILDERRRAAAESAAALLESKARVAAMKAEREQYLLELEEAKRIQEERRSWSHQEISSLKAQVDLLEKKSGWSVTGAQGTTLSLAYRREIELVFDVASFRAGQANTQIDLWYLGPRTQDARSRADDLHAGDLAGPEFFLPCIRDHVRSLRQAETHPAHLLKVVRASWDTARQAANQIRHFNLTFPTTTTKTSDTSLAVTVSVLLVPLQTKVEVTLHLRSLGCTVPARAGSTTGTAARLRIAVAAEARVVYGEPFNASKMGEFLSTRIGGRVAPRRHKAVYAGKAAAADRPVEFWVDAVEELRGKLLARGRK